MAAGDLTEAAALVQKNWMTFFDAGRSATVSAWMRALRGTPADADASATVAGAWIAALTGDRAELRRREAALAAMTGQDPLPDGTRSVLSALTLIRGLFGFAGPDRMLVDARQAIELEPDPSTPWHATASAALGHAAFVTGDVPLARAKWVRPRVHRSRPSPYASWRWGSCPCAKPSRATPKRVPSWRPRPWTW